MGLDHGAHTVGVSLSDELFLTAQPAEIIRREREGAIRKTLQRIETLVKEKGVCRIVVGLPLNMDGSESERAKAARDFGEKLEKRLGIPVEFSDERLTTVRAKELLGEMNIGWRDEKEYIDMMAANVILQEYLDNNRDYLRKEHGTV